MRRCGMVIVAFVAVCGTAFLKKAASRTEPGLVAHYTFDEGAGSIVYDRSGNGNEVTPKEGKWMLPEKAKKTGVKWLNNLVAELLHITKFPSRHGEWTFTNPRDGWVFLRSAAKVKGRGKVQIFVDGEGKPLIVHTEENAQTQEAMRFLPAGEHRLRVWQEGQAVVDSLVVRAIPELLYCKLGYDPWIKPHGPYDWRFLQKHILPHVNVIIGNGAEEQRLLAAEAKKQGKRWLVEVHAAPFFQRLSAEDSYRYWVNTPGLKEPVYDGIIVDEFLRKDEGVYEAIIESVRRLRLSKELRHKLFYPYCGNMFGARQTEEFIKTVMDCGYRFAWERYLIEQPNEAIAKKYLESALRDEMLLWRKAIPGCEAHMIVCFGFFDMIATSSLNINPQVDYKVWLDMQFQHVATDPAFAGIYGLMGWTSGYADEETLRWAARLYRHYGIEGKTEMLSKRYGFKYQLDHIQNPDFEEGVEGWKVEMAEEGSVDTKSFKGYNWLQGRYARIKQSDTFLWMKRSANKPNVISQEIKNLQPGKLYSLKMVTADYGDLVKGKSVEQKHAVSIRLDGVELVPEKCFQYVIANNYAQTLGPFNKDNPFWMNYHFLVFRAKGKTAKLTVSDWASATEPGGPIGQELMFNFVEVQPYLED